MRREMGEIGDEFQRANSLRPRLLHQLHVSVGDGDNRNRLRSDAGSASAEAWPLWGCPMCRNR